MKTRIAYKTLLEQIRLAKIHLEKLAKLGRGFAYRDYKKYYDNLHKEKQDYQKFLNILEEKGDDNAK
jgi:hypothetical protein